jgi:hypothetical protein
MSMAESAWRRVHPPFGYFGLGGTRPGGRLLLDGALAGSAGEQRAASMAAAPSRRAPTLTKRRRTASRRYASTRRRRGKPEPSSGAAPGRRWPGARAFRLPPGVPGRAPRTHDPPRDQICVPPAFITPKHHPPGSGSCNRRGWQRGEKTSRSVRPGVESEDVADVGCGPVSLRTE